MNALRRSIIWIIFVLPVAYTAQQLLPEYCMTAGNSRPESHDDTAHPEGKSHKKESLSNNDRS